MSAWFLDSELSTCYYFIPYIIEETLRLLQFKVIGEPLNIKLEDMPAHLCAVI